MLTFCEASLAVSDFVVPDPDPRTPVRMQRLPEDLQCGPSAESSAEACSLPRCRTLPRSCFRRRPLVASSSRPRIGSSLGMPRLDVGVTYVCEQAMLQTPTRNEAALVPNPPAGRSAASSRRGRVAFCLPAVLEQASQLAFPGHLVLIDEARPNPGEPYFHYKLCSRPSPPTAFRGK